MQKDLKGRSERSETILEAEDPGDEVDPCFDVFFLRFLREFLNAAAKLSSFVQTQQGQR